MAFIHITLLLKTLAFLVQKYLSEQYVDTPDAKFEIISAIESNKKFITLPPFKFIIKYLKILNIFYYFKLTISNIFSKILIPMSPSLDIENVCSATPNVTDATIVFIR